MVQIFTFLRHAGEHENKTTKISMRPLELEDGPSLFFQDLCRSVINIVTLHHVTLHHMLYI